MGFWKNIFRIGAKRVQEETQTDWEEIVYDHTEVDFHDEEQRSRYSTNCLQ